MEALVSLDGLTIPPPDLLYEDLKNRGLFSSNIEGIYLRRDLF